MKLDNTTHDCKLSYWFECFVNPTESNFIFQFKYKDFEESNKNLVNWCSGFSLENFLAALRRVRVTIVAVEKQYIFNIISVRVSILALVI